MSKMILFELAGTIKARRQSTAEKSYTKSLLDKGPARCAKKFGEEAVEAVIAAVSESDRELVGEAADVLFHLLVLLESRDITLEEVLEELDRRTHQSGHAEKASRPQN